MIAYPDDLNVRERGGPPARRPRSGPPDLVRRHPLMALGAAALTGYVLARLAARVLRG